MKLFTSIFLAGFVVGCGVTPAGFEGTSPGLMVREAALLSGPLRGDVNGDAALTVADIQCLVLTVLDTTPDDPTTDPACLFDDALADINCDGVANVVDVQLNVQMVLADLLGQSGIPADKDNDGDNVHNACDNCAQVANADQVNGDGDALGDSCDPHPGEIDECAANTDCADQATCVEANEGNDCQCGAGYEGNGLSCSDVDECVGTGGDQLCVGDGVCLNTVGSYDCGCTHDGYVYDANAMGCHWQACGQTGGRFWGPAPMTVEGCVFGLGSCRLEYHDVDYDDEYVYYVGWNELNEQPGAYVVKAAKCDFGVIAANTLESTAFRAMTMDAEHIFAVGYTWHTQFPPEHGNAGWMKHTALIVKIRKSDLALLAVRSYESDESNEFQAVTHDDNYVYAVGTDTTVESDGWTESALVVKFAKSDLSPVTNKHYGGTYEYEEDSYHYWLLPRDVVHDGTSLYVSGGAFSHDTFPFVMKIDKDSLNFVGMLGFDQGDYLGGIDYSEGYLYAAGHGITSYDGWLYVNNAIMVKLTPELAVVEQKVLVAPLEEFHIGTFFTKVAAHDGQVYAVGYAAAGGSPVGYSAGLIASFDDDLTPLGTKLLGFWFSNITYHGGEDLYTTKLDGLHLQYSSPSAYRIRTDRASDLIQDPDQSINPFPEWFSEPSSLEWVDYASPSGSTPLNEVGDCDHLNEVDCEALSYSTTITVDTTNSPFFEVPKPGAPGDSCGPNTQMTSDCSGSCERDDIIAAFSGDGICDDVLAPDLNCAALDFEGGDCP